MPVPRYSINVYTEMIRGNRLMRCINVSNYNYSDLIPSIDSIIKNNEKVLILGPTRSGKTLILKEVERILTTSKVPYVKLDFKLDSLCESHLEEIPNDCVVLIDEGSSIIQEHSMDIKFNQLNKSIFIAGQGSWRPEFDNLFDTIIFTQAQDGNFFVSV